MSQKLLYANFLSTNLILTTYINFNSFLRKQHSPISYYYKFHLAREMSILHHTQDIEDIKLFCFHLICKHFCYLS